MRECGSEGFGSSHWGELVPFDVQYEKEGKRMNWKRTARWSWLLLPFVLLALWPGVAAAQLGVRSDANAVLYEVTENLKLKPLASGHRQATAALMGTVNEGTAICPESIAYAASGGAVTTCNLTAMASDNISLATGKGPVEGTFAVVIQGDNPVDGPELVILKGTLEGKIDLSPAVLGGVPIGTIKGRWKAKGVEGGPLQGVRARGTFTGTFRLPFVIPPDFGTALYFGEMGPVPVQFNELSLAVPTVRLELNFVETHHHDDH